ncbi:MAG: MauE/DoxX family redox-associated membrane protein [Planctomycetota bacterium]
MEFELFFGLWLLANIQPEWTRRAAIACFAVFAAVSLYRAFSGAASCGCFGRVVVNPWYTFAMAVGAVLALLRWQAFEPSSSTRHLSWTPARRAVAVTSVWFVSAPLVGWRRCCLRQWTTHISLRVLCK